MKNAERAQRVVADSSEVIEAAVARLSELLERLRSFAAIDEAPVKSCQPSELVDNVLALLSHAIGSDVEVVRSYQPVPGLVAHSAKLSQIFMTLLLNAIDAVDGRGRIEVGCCAHEDRIEVTIADDGRGMSEDQLLTLFEPTFSSGERTRPASACGSLRTSRATTAVRSGSRARSEKGRSLPSACRPRRRRRRASRSTLDFAPARTDRDSWLCAGAGRRFASTRFSVHA